VVYPLRPSKSESYLFKDGAQDKKLETDRKIQTRRCLPNLEEERALQKLMNEQALFPSGNI